MIARALLLAILCTACAALRAPDADERAELVALGFREASPFVDALVADAAAWAVFPAVEDPRPTCVHDGVLTRRSGASEPARVRCLAPTTYPAGESYHLLVVLLDDEDVARLDAGPLPLAGSAAYTADDDPPERGTARRWLVSTRRRSLLFEQPELVQVLELGREGDR